MLESVEDLWVFNRRNGFTNNEDIHLYPPLSGLHDFYDDEVNRIYVLSMPLGQKQASMILIMPYHLEPLERLEKLLTKKQVDIWISKMTNKAVAISLPKISLDVSHNIQVNGLTNILN